MSKERRAELLKVDTSDLWTMAWKMGLTWKTDATKRNVVTKIIEAEEGKQIERPDRDAQRRIMQP